MQKHYFKKTAKKVTSRIRWIKDCFGGALTLTSLLRDITYLEQPNGKLSHCQLPKLGWCAAENNMSANRTRHPYAQQIKIRCINIFTFILTRGASGSEIRLDTRRKKKNAEEIYPFLPYLVHLKFWTRTFLEIFLL